MQKSKGFTLIELLIVVAILGVLAAVIIPNVGRFLNRGQHEASETELTTMQAAVQSMMVDKGLIVLPAGDYAAGLNSTKDMTKFPAGTYPLYGSSARYIVQNESKGTYTVDAFGTVTQVTTGY